MAPQPDFLDPDDLHWHVLSAVRSAFSVAERSEITYSDALKHLKELAPDFASRSPYWERCENALRDYFIDLAALLTSQKRPTTPAKLVTTEIEKLKRDLKDTPQHEYAKVRRYLQRLEALRVDFDTRTLNENKAIVHDYETPPLSKFSKQFGTANDGFREYPIDGNRAMRIRLLHPDNGEHKTGVDLVYEYHLKDRRGRKWVRTAALQYKMWDGGDVYYSQVKNLKSQCEKAKSTFCAAKICGKQRRLPKFLRQEFRFPSCGVFLRLTDKLQPPPARLMTHGNNLTLCCLSEELEQTANGFKVLRPGVVYRNGLVNSTFGELFNRGMVGSEWIKADRLAKLYKACGIFADHHTLFVHTKILNIA